MPNASIFINILRAVVWTLAVGTVLQPVFGINPTTIFTALGIGGLAVSLGMKDTIANIIGGFGLMLGRVIQPGDLVNVAGTDGVVEDINWRQTVVRERNGNIKIIPNSILNTASLEKLNPSNEMLVRVPFTAKAGSRHRRDDPSGGSGRAARYRRFGRSALPSESKTDRLLPLRHQCRSVRVRQAGIVASRHDQRRGTFHRQC